MKFNKTIKIALVIAGIILLILTYAVITTYSGDNDKQAEDQKPTESVKYQDEKSESEQEEKPGNLKKNDQLEPEKEVETDQKATEKAEVEKPKTQPKPATVPSYKPYVAPTPKPIPAPTKAEETKTEARFAPETWVDPNAPVEPKLEPAPEPQPEQVSKPQPGYIDGSCKQLREKDGIGDFRPGDPNYTKERDRDDDGIACEIE